MALSARFIGEKFSFDLCYIFSGSYCVGVIDGENRLKTVVAGSGAGFQARHRLGGVRRGPKCFRKEKSS